MRQVSALFGNYNGTFPNYSGKNATGAGATDGTEWIAGYIDDYGWGWAQALMDHENLTPNGVAEAAGASQILDAIQLLFPPGMIAEWNINVDPATLGARFLYLNGQGILRANYADLDANVYVGDGNNAAVAAAGGAFYHADDAAGTIPNTAGVYLILPESRGYTVRGLDLAASIDPLGASRYLGDNQVDAMQRITGAATAVTAGSNSAPFASGSGAFSVTVPNGTGHGNGTAASRFEQLLYDNSGSTSPNTAKTDDVETRMTNRSTKFVIRY